MIPSCIIRIPKNQKIVKLKTYINVGIVTVQPYGFTATIDAHKVQKEHFGA
jgi:hypothetical protein